MNPLLLSQLENLPEEVRQRLEAEMLYSSMNNQTYSGPSSQERTLVIPGENNYETVPEQPSSLEDKIKYLAGIVASAYGGSQVLSSVQDSQPLGVAGPLALLVGAGLLLSNKRK